MDRFRFSFRNALDGLRTAFKTQRNFRIHLLFAIAVIAFSVVLKLSTTEFSVVLLTILFVLATEIFNTAVESAIDLVSPEFNKIAKKSKDVSAAGVLIAAIFAAMIGILIFLPKIVARIVGYL